MLTFEELLELWNDEATRADMTGEQLDALRTGFEDRARELLDGERTDEVLAELEQIATSVAAVDEAVATAAAAEAAAEAAAQDLATRIFGAADEGGEGEGGEAAEGEGEDAPAEGEPVVEVPAEGAEVPDAEEVPEAVAAAAADVAYRPRITNVNARRPAASRPRPTAAATPSTLVASANMGGVIAAGQVLDSPEALGAAFLAAWDASQGFKNGRQKISVARSGGDPLDLYGEDRYLDSSARSNHRKIEALCGREAITAAARAMTASGGACIPPPVMYDLPIIVGTEARPVRDEMMVRFGADRAGVVTLPPPVLTDLTNAVSDWSMENDEAPGSHGNATKPCLTVTCPDETTDHVDAIVKCMRFGNFRSRFFGEQVQAWLDLAAVWHARHAERKLLAAIGAGSTQVTSGTVLGTTRDVLAVLDRASAQFQARHRTGDGYPLRWAAPMWLRDQISVDIARQMPVGTLDETLALADASIDRWLAVREIRPTWFLDGENATQEMSGPQADGPLKGWPSTVVSYLYPEGVWQFLDGGMFDFGVVRDSTLNATNDFQVFSETLEGSHFHGVESMRLELDVCPDGSASALVDIAPCGVGS